MAGDSGEYEIDDIIHKCDRHIDDNNVLRRYHGAVRSGNFARKGKLIGTYQCAKRSILNGSNKLAD